MSSFMQRAARLPIIGYLGKVVHDLVKIPIIRQDLHNDVVGLRRDLAALGAQSELLKRHLDQILVHLSEHSSQLHQMESLPDGLRAVRREQVWLKASLQESDRQRSDDLTGQLTKVRADLAALSKEVMNVSELASLVKGFAPSLQAIRSELLAEVNLRLAAREQDRGNVIPRVVNPGKLFQFPNGVRLNLGCGVIPVEGYLNVDRRELKDVDVLADVGNLPFGPGSVSGIYAAHILEHFEEKDLSARLLPYWKSLMKDGGEFRIIVPDAEAMLGQYQKQEIGFDQLRLVTFGGQDYAGNYHYTMFSRESLRSLLRNAGLEAGDYSALGRPNGLCLEMEIVATKPATIGRSSI